MSRCYGLGLVFRAGGTRWCCWATGNPSRSLWSGAPNFLQIHWSEFSEVQLHVDQTSCCCCCCSVSSSGWGCFQRSAAAAVVVAETAMKVFHVVATSTRTAMHRSTSAMMVQQENFCNKQKWLNIGFKTCVSPTNVRVRCKFRRIVVPTRHRWQGE